MEWHHNCVVIATEGSDFDALVTCSWYKVEGPSCYGNQTVYQFHSAMVWNAYYAPEIFILHTSAKFEKSETNFLKQIIFLYHLTLCFI